MNGTGADKNCTAADNEKSLALAKHRVIYKLSRKEMSWPNQDEEKKIEN